MHRLIKISLNTTAKYSDSRYPMLDRKMMTQLIDTFRHTRNRHQIMMMGFLEKLVENLNPIRALLTGTNYAKNLSRQQRHISQTIDLFYFWLHKLKFEMKI